MNAPQTSHEWVRQVIRERPELKRKYNTGALAYVILWMLMAVLMLTGTGGPPPFEFVAAGFCGACICFYMVGIVSWACWQDYYRRHWAKGAK